jgi:nicotinate-nucleotide adenylyltransferase
MRLIGIFGGTFDPIHYGHLRTFAQVHRQIRFDKALFIPAATPPHRNAPVATAAQRLAMLRLALNEYPEFAIDERELHRQGPSYTVDTLQSLRDDYDGYALCLIIGLDAFLGLNTWHRWQDIPTLAHVVVMQRPGWKADNRLPDWCWQTKFENIDTLRGQPAGVLCMSEVDPIDISASAIRAKLKCNEDIAGLLPDTVKQYLLENKLYQ